MTSLATAFVTIRPDTAGFGARLSKSTSLDADRAGKQAGGKFSSGLKSSLKVGGILAGAFAVTKGVSFFKDAIEEAGEARKVGAQTAAVLKSTGGAAGITAKGIGDLATAISNKTAIDDEAIQSGANLLLTFKNIKNGAGEGNDIFNQTTSIMTDMAAAMGTDVKGGAIQLGKALNDPIKGVGALSRVGVTFDEGQKKTIKRMVETGNTMGAQKIILRELNSEFAGSAEAQATPAEKARVAWGNFKEMIGTAVLPIIDKLATFISERVLPAVTNFVEGIKDGTGAGGRFKSIMEIVGKVASAVGRFIGGELVPFIRDLAKRFSDAMGGADGFRKTLKDAKPAVDVLKTVIKFLWEALKFGARVAIPLIVSHIKTMAKVIGGVGTAIKKTAGFFKSSWEAAKEATKKAVLYVADKALWMAEKLLGVFAKLPGKMGKPFKEALAKVKEFRKGVNAEMDAINDESVKVTVTTVSPARRSKVAAQLANSGGGGPLPTRATNRMGAVGGLGLLPKMSAPLGPVRSAARNAQAIAHEAMMDRASEVQASLKKEAAARAKAAKAGRMGAAGPAGRILPRGSYSIGMPYHGYPGHNGADYPAATGTPVYAPWAGRVTASYDLPGSNPYNSTPYRSYGRVVKIAYANGMSSLFAHLSSRIGRTGPIAAGTMVGRVGMNGNATGPHLHAEFNGGRTNPASLGLFDRGGILRHGGAAINLSGRTERILDPRTTRNFERLTNSLDSVGVSGGGDTYVLVDRDGTLMATLRGVADSSVKGHAAHGAKMGRARS